MQNTPICVQEVCTHNSTTPRRHSQKHYCKWGAVVILLIHAEHLNTHRAAFKVVMAVSEAIREAGSLLAGPLYANLMPLGCTIDQFDQIVSILTGSGMVARSGDMLRWIGPVIR